MVTNHRINHCVQEEGGGDQRFGCTIAKYSIYEDTTSSLGSKGRKWDSRVWMHYSYWIAVFDFKENVWLYMGQLRARFVVVRRKLRSSNANCSNNQNESFFSFNGYCRHTLFAYDYCTPKKLFVTKKTFKK